MINYKNKKRSAFKYIAREERRHLRNIDSREVRHRLKKINSEFKKGFKALKHHPNTVTFFGSARFQEDNKYYQQARLLAKHIVEELDATIVTGGGGGIMEAANRGGSEAHGKSLGMTIRLPHEQVTNGYVNGTVDFYYFFSRKVALTFTARAYIYFPGGFGTLDELFEILTLKQTQRIDQLPIILVGTEFWTPLLDYIEDTLVDKNQTVSKNETELYTLTDDFDKVIELIKG